VSAEVSPIDPPSPDTLASAGAWSGELPAAAAAGPPAVMIGIPAYNESRYIGSVVLQARDYGDLVVVVDDGSEDDTAIVAERAGARVIRHPQNRGKGESLNTLFQAARQLGAQSLVLIDADGQHRPWEIAGVLDPVCRGEADLVVGSRVLYGNSGVPGLRYGGQRVITWLTNVTSGTPLTDSQSGFRAFSQRAIEALTFTGRGFSVESEMQFLAAQHGLRVKEVPISTVYLDPPRRNVVKHGLMVLNGILHLVERARPLLFFGVPGTVVLLAGLLMGGWVVEIYARFQELAVGYALISVLLSIAGLLGVSTGLVLHTISGYFADLRHQLSKR
jgi:glycosyltransferase involved in cell wall biosynthesis